MGAIHGIDVALAAKSLCSVRTVKQLGGAEGKQNECNGCVSADQVSGITKLLLKQFSSVQLSSGGGIEYTSLPCSSSSVL